MAGRLDSADALADEALGCATTAGDDWAIALTAFAKAMGAPTTAERRQRVDQAASLLDETGNIFRLAGLYASAAYEALWDGSDRDAKDFIDAACNRFCEELALCRDLVVRPYVFEGLRGLAAVAMLRDDVHRAALLVGAAAAHRYGEPEDPVDARLDTTFFEPARTLHGADAWDAAVREGAALSYEDAIAYALDEPRK